MSTTKVRGRHSDNDHDVSLFVSAQCKVWVFLCADPNILNAIYNSEALNDVFISNFQKDPTLTWQFFGSSTGFFRIYPGESSVREKN